MMRNHRAKFANGMRYYSFCFKLPDDEDIGKLANTLLQKRVADFARSPKEGEGRFSHRFTEDKKLARKLLALYDFDQRNKRWSQLLVWAGKNPRLATQVFASTTKNVLTKDNEDGAPQDSRERGIHTEAMEAYNKLRESRGSSQLPIALQAEQDKNMYFPGYLGREPFIRLQLRSFYLNPEMKDRDEVYVTLVLHKSGVSILTFAMKVQEGLDTSGLLRISKSHEAGLDQFVLPEEIWDPLKVDPSYPLRVDIADDRDATHWHSVRPEPGYYFPVSDIFGFYQSTILNLCRKKNGIDSWLCHTTISIRGLLCCKNKRKWMKNHKNELAGLLMRHGSYRRISNASVDEVLATDRALHGDASNFFLGSNSFFMDWKFEDENFPTNDTISDIAQDTSHLTLIESALFQYWQLRVLDEKISRSKLDLRSLSKIQRDLVVGLQEYKSSTLAYGTAKEAADEILDKLGAAELYARVTERANRLDQLVNSTSASMNARKGAFFSALSVAVAAFIGLPAIHSAIELLAGIDWKSRVPFAGDYIGELLSHEIKTTIILYIAFVVTLLCLLLIRIRPRNLHKASSNNRFGIAWPEAHLNMKLEVKEPD